MNSRLLPNGRMEGDSHVWQTGRRVEVYAGAYFYECCDREVGPTEYVTAKPLRLIQESSPYAKSHEAVHHP